MCFYTAFYMAYRLRYTTKKYICKDEQEYTCEFYDYEVFTDMQYAYEFS